MLHIPSSRCDASANYGHMCATRVGTTYTWQTKGYKEWDKSGEEYIYYWDKPSKSLPVNILMLPPDGLHEERALT